jgi:hypothetical protein
LDSKFKIDDSKLEIIAEKFNVELKSVQSVYDLFSLIVNGVKKHYLAHIIRSMEEYLRKTTNNPMFQINCYPYDEKSPVLNVGCAQYFPKSYFTVFFHPRMDDKQLRVCLAHELGHLFIIELLNNTDNNGKQFTKDDITEPLSSIFGVLTIMDKNEFYENCGTKYNHDTWQAILSEFISLSKRHGI